MAGDDAGCVWITSHTQRWDGRLQHNVKVPVYCHKVTAPDSSYCPRHELLGKTLGYPQKQKELPKTYTEEGKSRR